MELKDYLEFVVSAGKNPFAGTLAVVLVFGWFWYRGQKQSKAIARLQKQLAEFEGLIRGVAFYQCEPTTDRIMLATPQLAALLGLAVTDIVDKPFHKVFDHAACETIRDMHDRLARHDEVVNHNFNLHGAVCTIAMRKVFTNSGYYFITHIHRQDTRL
jgi:hypothetical protein